MSKYVYQDNLESPRVLTRYLTKDDIKSWSSFFNDDEATEFLPNPGIQSNEERSAYWIEKQLNRYRNKLFGLQALISKETNEFIGQCGLLTQTVDEKIEVEVGYHIFKKYWGRGYAPEAAKIFIDFAFRNDLANSIISIINVNNIKSQRVANKNFLIREKQAVWSGLDVYIYRIDNSKK